MLIFAAVLLVGACYTGPDADHYAGLLDELAVPADWELAHTSVKAPGGLDDCAPIFPSCPSVARYYLVHGDPAGAYPVARQMLTWAGFEIDQESGADCDLPPGGAARRLSGVRDAEAIRVTLTRRGDDLDGLGIAEGEGFIVRVSAEGG